LSDAEKILMVDEILYRLIDKDVDIRIASSSYDEMVEKIESMRDGQDDNLEKEANRAFGAVEFADNPFL